jgi:hypothetical protein
VKLKWTIGSQRCQKFNLEVNSEFWSFLPTNNDLSFTLSYLLFSQLRLLSKRKESFSFEKWNFRSSQHKIPLQGILLYTYGVCVCVCVYCCISLSYATVTNNLKISVILKKRNKTLTFFLLILFIYHWLLTIPWSIPHSRFSIEGIVPTWELLLSNGTYNFLPFSLAKVSHLVKFDINIHSQYPQGWDFWTMTYLSHHI